MGEMEPHFEPDETSIFDALKVSDDSQNILFGLLEEYTPKKHADYVAAIGDKASDTIHPFRQVVETFLDDDESDTEEKAQIIANYFSEVHHDRIQQFTDIAPGASFIELVPHEAGMSVEESMACVIQENLEDGQSNDELAASITGQYADFLAKDCTALMRELSSYRTLTGYLRSKFTESAWDIGKTAAGVALGGLIAGAILRKKDL